MSWAFASSPRAEKDFRYIAVAADGRQMEQRLVEIPVPDVRSGSLLDQAPDNLRVSLPDRGHQGRFPFIIRGVGIRTAVDEKTSDLGNMEIRRAQYPVQRSPTAPVKTVDIGAALDQGRYGVQVAGHGREMEREKSPGHDFGFRAGLEEDLDELRLSFKSGAMESGSDPAFNADIRPGGDQYLDEFHRSLFDTDDQRRHIEGIARVDVGSPFNQQAGSLCSALSRDESQRGQAAVGPGIDFSSFVQQKPDEVQVSAEGGPVEGRFAAPVLGRDQRGVRGDERADLFQIPPFCGLVDFICP